MQQNEYDDWNTFQILRPDRENIDWDVFWYELLVEFPIFLLVVFVAANLFRIWLGLNVANLKTAAQLTGVIPDKETDELMAAVEKEEKVQKAQRKPKRRYEVVSAYNEEHKIEDDFGFDD